MGILLSRIWGLRIFRRGDENLLSPAHQSDSETTGSCESVITCSTPDSAELELNNGGYDMSHSHSNLVQHNPSTPILVERLNQDLLLRYVSRRLETINMHVWGV